MKLKELIEGLECRISGPVDIEISGVTSDSRSVCGGEIFAAIKGEAEDGADFIDDAVERGAASILSRPASRHSERGDITEIIARDVRAALAEISDRFYGGPGKSLTIAGITGTNGKTTSAYIIESILREAGIKTGVIGTVNYRYGDRVISAGRTTPEPTKLSGLLADMASDGVTHCVMEVSSHALKQKRVDGCRFKAALYTQMTHEHLDYHGTMEDYFLSKSRLFDELLAEGDSRAVINTDDPRGRSLAERAGSAITYGMSEEADIHPESHSFSVEGMRATLSAAGKPMEISSSLTGGFNLMNIMGAVGVGLALGVEPETIEKGVSALKGVPGRLERVGPNGEYSAYVDYAHTADALERAIGALKPLTSGRLITVFGCGGDRDREKRAFMGQVAAKLSDISIITSDNPRSEDPLDIIREIEVGMKGLEKFPDGVDGKGYMVVPDRGEAIEKAVALAGAGDTLLIAGKGHEDYQLVGDKRLDFDDRRALAEGMECRVRGTD